MCLTLAVPPEAAIFEDMEVFYNRQRGHTAIGGCSAAEAEGLGFSRRAISNRTLDTFTAHLLDLRSMLGRSATYLHLSSSSRALWFHTAIVLAFGGLLSCGTAPDSNAADGVGSAGGGGRSGQAGAGGAPGAAGHGGVAGAVGSGATGGFGGTSGFGGGAGVGGDGGLGVVTSALIVRANGVEIGYLLGATDFYLVVWDPTLDIRFQVNDVTGFIVGWPHYSYTSNDCTGVKYQTLGWLGCGAADAGLPSLRRWVLADDGGDGFVQPSGLLIQGIPERIIENSIYIDGTCYDQSSIGSEVCKVPLEPTSIIPTAFPLPITVSAN